MTDDASRLPPVRRVVTGHDSNNVAKVLFDGTDLNVREGSSPGARSTLIWCSDRTPSDIAVGESVEDMGRRTLGTAPPKNGVRVTVNDLPPGRTSAMHRTETVDYVFVLEGEVEMDLDDSVVRMKAGDVMVQRGTNHAWRNASSKPARVAFVLVDAEPLGIGAPVLAGSVAGGKH